LEAELKEPELDWDTPSTFDAADYGSKNAFDELDQELGLPSN
tara:strand:+ start:300 stop:425 length:126 start_codon:yes stop_codon:yes gene_type:complete